MKQAWERTKGDVKPAQVPDEQVREARATAMNLFMMLLVDGVPEGILMGFMAAQGFLSPTFTLSLLVANFPEAFASSTLFLPGQMPVAQILALWTGLMLLVGSLAGISCYLLLMLPGFDAR